MNFNELIHQIEERYISSNERMGKIFERVAAYYLRNGLKFKEVCFVDLDNSPVKGVDLLAYKIEDDLSGRKHAQWYSIQVSEHLESGQELSSKTIEGFVQKTTDMDIPGIKMMLILFGCPLSNEGRDYIYENEIELMTEENISQLPMDWTNCWKSIEKHFG